MARQHSVCLVDAHLTIVAIVTAGFRCPPDTFAVKYTAIHARKINSKDTNADSVDASDVDNPMQAVRLSLKHRACEICLKCLAIPSTASVMPFPQGPYVEATAEPYRVKIKTPISSAKKAATNLTLATPVSVLCRRPGILACSVDHAHTLVSQHMLAAVGTGTAAL